MKRGNSLRNIFTIFLHPFHRKRQEAPPVFSAPARNEMSDRRHPHRFAEAGTTHQSYRRPRAARKRLRKISNASRRANR